MSEKIRKKRRKNGEMARTGKPVLARGRRGRPTLDQAKEIDAAVVHAAHTMFLGAGYNTTSMEAIAKRAGVSKRTLYAKFPTKGELFTEVVVAQVARWSKQAGRLDYTLGKTLRERLEHHAIMFLEAQAEPEAQAFGRLLLTEAHQFPDVGRI